MAEDTPVIIVTMNDIPGCEVEETLGEVFGLTVRTRNLGSLIVSAFRSLFGGELRGMTQMLIESRQQAISRLVEEAESRGGNAIIAMRFDASGLGSTWTEICAYGTLGEGTKTMTRVAFCGTMTGRSSHLGVLLQQEATALRARGVGEAEPAQRHFADEPDSFSG